MLDADGEWWARREVKPGKIPPPHWLEVEADEVTGKRVGWEPIEQSPFAKAFADAGKPSAPDTYELVGPKINGNPHCLLRHTLYRHGIERVAFAPHFLTFDGLRLLLAAYQTKCVSGWMEGLVWHHPDGRRAKIKVRDFDYDAKADHA
jgi:hypothetical protein